MSTTAPPRKPWYRPMTGRDPQESHRASTPLELLFDLCFVVAVAQAGFALEGQIEEGHVGHGVLAYLMVFFAIWWAWMNFSWFASAYDTDDVPYRLTVLVQIAGSLVMAAGIDRAVTGDDYAIITWGYVLMRLAMVTQWIRAARSDPEHRDTALLYAAGITVVQALWLLRLLLPLEAQFVTFFVLVVAELAVPAVAERRSVTSYHPHHITERYGEFTVIVLGEAVTAAALAVKAGLAIADRGASIIVLAAMALLILFAMWWLYFDHQTADRLQSLRGSLTWGYGHYFVFSGIAAVGVGLAISVVYDTRHAAAAEDGHELTSIVAAAALTIPVAVYLLAMFVLHIGGTRNRIVHRLTPVAAALVLAATFTRAPVHLIAAILVVLVVVMLLVTRRRVAADADRAA